MMENSFSKVASLIGDPVRSKIMWALIDGKAYTATELAMYAETTAPNISMHLNKLVNADLLAVEKQGRHCYYTYSRHEIAYAIEALANLIPPIDNTIATGPAEQPVRFCRTCYNHLAGKVGVMLADSLLAQGLVIKTETDFEVTARGEVFFKALAIDVDNLRGQKRSFAKACLDWSERRHHIAGALGTALLQQMLTNGWIRRTENSRAIVITGKGRQALYDLLKLEV